MTEITRVPIQPVAKGSLTKLWLGVVLAIAVGAGLAWAAVPRGVDVDTITAGTGPMPKDGDVLFIEYKGKLAADGTVFDESRDIPLPVEGIFPKGTPFPIEEGATIPGFFEGLKQMQKGSDGMIRFNGPQPPEMDATVQITSGFLESSNVNAVEEMTSVLALSRQFELHVKMMKTAEEDDQSMARVLQLG